MMSSTFTVYDVLTQAYDFFQSFVSFATSLSLSLSLTGRVGSWQAQSPTSLVTAGGGSLWALSQQWTHTLAQHTHSAACLVQPALPLSWKMGKHGQWSPDVLDNKLCIENTPSLPNRFSYTHTRGHSHSFSFTNLHSGMGTQLHNLLHKMINVRFSWFSYEMV